MRYRRQLGEISAARSISDPHAPLNSFCSRLYRVVRSTRQDHHGVGLGKRLPVRHHIHSRVARPERASGLFPMSSTHLGTSRYANRSEQRRAV